MYEIILQIVPSVEKLGDTKEWIYYMVSILASYSIATSLAIKFLYKSNTTLHDKYDGLYSNFLEEQKTFYKLYIDSSDNLANVIKNNSIAFLSVENTIKNNTLRVEELNHSLKEQSEKTINTLDKLTEKILEATKL